MEDLKCIAAEISTSLADIVAKLARIGNVLDDIAFEALKNRFKARAHMGEFFWMCECCGKGVPWDGRIDHDCLYDKDYRPMDDE